MYSGGVSRKPIGQFHKLSFRAPSFEAVDHQEETTVYAITVRGRNGHVLGCALPQNSCEPAAGVGKLTGVRRSQSLQIIAMPQFQHQQTPQSAGMITPTAEVLIEELLNTLTTEVATL